MGDKGDLSGMIGLLAVGPLPGWATLALVVALVLLLLLCAAVCCLLRRGRNPTASLATQVSGFRLGRAQEAQRNSEVPVVLRKRGERPAPPPPPPPSTDGSGGWLTGKLNTSGSSTGYRI